MDLARLRNVLRLGVVGLGQRNTHAELPNVCVALGLPAPPGADEFTKRQRVETSFDGLGDGSLVDVAKRYLELYVSSASERNRIQELLWSEHRAPDVPKKFRREVARVVERGPLYIDMKQFDELLDRLWVLDPDDLFEAVFTGADSSLRKQIERHVHRNPGDWSVEELFENLGVYECSNRRFALFLEGLASADVRPDEDAQRRFVALVNGPLRRCGVELRECASEGGYPVFTLVALAQGAGRPKNLIFASKVKPDLRLSDAVSNDVEIVTNADKVLVYDRPIGAEGLRWRDLQLWWAERNDIGDEREAKKSLYHRLVTCFPEEPPQRVLFDAFLRGFGSLVPELPALVPEVWLHWDPKNQMQRGPDALRHFRMDFLLLLPGAVRVVVEVDGKQHYAHADRADAGRYAKMAAADRETKLAGYEVYRFGAAELPNKATAIPLVKSFFEKLFGRHGIVIQR